MNPEHTPWEPNPANDYMLKPWMYPTYKKKWHTHVVRPVRNKTAGLCGHKIDTGCHPKTKCIGCWAHFFIQNKKATNQNIELIRAGKTDEVKREAGKRYVKMLNIVLDLMEEAKQKMEVEKVKEGTDAEVV